MGLEPCDTSAYMPKRYTLIFGMMSIESLFLQVFKVNFLLWQNLSLKFVQLSIIEVFIEHLVEGRIILVLNFY